MGEIENIFGGEAGRGLTAGQKKTLQRYHNHLRAEGRTHNSQVSYLRTMVRFTPFLEGRGYEEVTRKDFERFMVYIQDKKMRANTIKHWYNLLHRFYTWLGSFEEVEEEGRYIRILKKVRYKPPKGELHVIKAEELPSQEEIKQLIRYAVNLRDKAIIAMLWDIGARPHELLNLKISDVHFDEYGAFVTVGEHGKTGARTLRLIFSLPYLREWIESHPFREEPQRSLFPNMANNAFGGQLTTFSLRRSIQKAAKLAKVNKHLYSYLFRHASITREAGNGLGDQELKTFYGWTPSSKMLQVYSHLTSEDVNRKRLETAGIVKAKEKVHELNLKKCPRCNAENAPTADYCSKCSSPLDEARYREMLSKEQELTELKAKLSEVEAVLGDIVKARELTEIVRKRRERER